MNIIPIKDPFPHLLIEDIYSDEELIYIWKELNFLTAKNILNPPHLTGSATEDGKCLKNNNAVFLDDFYTNRDSSYILNLNAKIFDKKILNCYSELSFGYNSIKKINHDRTIISYYQNGDYYDSHSDASLYTAITWFYKEPKKYKGGDLIFSEYDYLVIAKNNSTILFPSFVFHKVEKVIIEENKIFTGNARYSMSQFLYLIP
jgi:hypothetical protein